MCLGRVLCSLIKRHAATWMIIAEVSTAFSVTAIPAEWGGAYACSPGLGYSNTLCPLVTQWRERSGLPLWWHLRHLQVAFIWYNCDSCVKVLQSMSAAQKFEVNYSECFLGQVPLLGLFKSLVCENSHLYWDLCIFILKVNLFRVGKKSVTNCRSMKNDMENLHDWNKNL